MVVPLPATLQLVPSSDQTSLSTNDNDDNSILFIVGGSIACVVVLLCAIMALILFRKSTRKTDVDTGVVANDNSDRVSSTTMPTSLTIDNRTESNIYQPGPAASSTCKIEKVF
jgi:hypothetical protein